jgi:hypothetical protein
MDDDKYRPVGDGPDRLPSLFTVNELVEFSQFEWIVKHLDGCLEADVVLGPVAAVLLFVPLKFHASPPLRLSEM